MNVGFDEKRQMHICEPYSAGHAELRLLVCLYKILKIHSCTS